MDQLNELRIEFERHEAVCEERWKTVFNEIRSAKEDSKGRTEEIKASVQSLHRLIWAGGGAVILFLAGIIVSGTML